MTKVQRILVPVDFSETSKRALEWAFFFANRFDAKLDVLHVWRPSEYAGDEMVVLTRSEPELTLSTYLHNHADQQLSAFLENVPHSKQLLESGEPAQVIVKVAGEGGYDLIVMGTHGRTGLSHLRMGSVAEKVVRLAPCPVFTYRMPSAK
ncbi:universal stress protein [Vitiosangium sp. GDMCC 1.1324]|uniref:universal stress protein n=1 Tax=Vitiosangium sp. (strain GDMCC 1.1324) TaxID=2138576 RepID=UPI000D347EF7|nr:universal stress protein [Vitiosangium sp. GDMCC 1.1324]PTL75511.1 universal stress protein [Vitiosangium sp. GDMCC 1.1324]